MNKKSNWLGTALLLLFFLSILLNGTFFVMNNALKENVEKLENQVSNKNVELINQASINSNVLKEITSNLNTKIVEQEKEIKSLELDLLKRSKELLALNGKQRTLYEEQRSKWRNYVAGIMNEMVKDLEHTSRKCWDSDRDDFEDCIDDEFEDDSDQPINQVLNLA